MYCTQYGEKLSGQARFCTACGAPVKAQQSRSAAIEQAEQDEAADALQPLQQASQAEEPVTFKAAMDSTKAKSRRKIPPALLLALAMLLVTSLAFAAYSAYRYYVENVQTPNATVERFTQAVGDLDLNAAVACMDEQARRQYETAFSTADAVASALGIPLQSGTSQALTEDFVKRLIPSLSDLSGVDLEFTLTLEDVDESIEGDRARVTGTWQADVYADGEHASDTAPVAFNLALEWGSWRIQNDADFARSVWGEST